MKKKYNYPLLTPGDAKHDCEIVDKDTAGKRDEILNAGHVTNSKAG
jgi:hypothetical protein